MPSISSSTFHKKLHPLLIILITLLAFLLRAYQLDGQSYWIDEGLTIRYANLSLTELWESLQTVRAVPPIYHVLTIYWVKLVGDGEYALRFLSLVFSVLAVPLSYRLGKALSGKQVGLIVALLMAVAPYQVWHGQDARNYSLLTMATALSMWGFINLWQRGGWQWWLIYIIGTELAIMTHYHGLVIIGIQGLFLLITWQRHWRKYLQWGGVLIIILAPFILWLVFGSSLWQSDHWLPQVGLWDSYLRSAIAYSVGELVPHPQALWLTAIFLLFYSIGLITILLKKQKINTSLSTTNYQLPTNWRGWEKTTFLLTFTLAPNIAAWLYSILKTSVYLERYLIPVQIGYLLAIAIGLTVAINTLSKKLTAFHLPSMLAQASSMLLLISLLWPATWVLQQHYHNPVYAKANWRGVAEKIENFGLPDDAILMTGDGGELLMQYYYKGDLPIYFDFNTPVPSIDEARNIISTIASKHRRLWYTPYGVDIDATLENWLAKNTYPAWHAWLGRKRLALYQTQPTLNRTETVNHLFTNVDGIGPTLISINLPNQPIMAGDLLPLNFTWQTNAKLPQPYKLSLRLINSTSDIFAQSDWPDLTAVTPTTAWPIAHPIPDNRSLWIPVDTPPDSYALQLVVYEANSGNGVGQPFTLDNITVNPSTLTPPLTALFRPNAIEQTLGPLTLVGYAAPTTIQPGEEMWLWFYWQLNNDLDPEITLEIALNSGDETVNNQQALTDSVGSLENWQIGQVRRAVYHLPTSPRLNNQKGLLTLSLLNPSAVPIAQTTLAQPLNLAIRPRQFTMPPIQQPLTAAFGEPEKLVLLGYDLPNENISANTALPITLYWQAKAEMDVSYTIFIQLLDENNTVISQVDEKPLKGQAPTSTWLPNEILTDPHTLPLNNLPSGEYRLIVGLYNANNNQRLPLKNDGDFVELGKLTIN